jgi:FixJ family two-component response regulator
MNANDHIVFVIDDDPAVCKSLERLLRTAGHATETFGSLTDFLSREYYRGAGCFVLDVCLPDISGLEASQKLSDANYNLPTVFISGYADVPTSVRAMKSGAIDYLLKPVGVDDLLSAVRTALDKERRQRIARAGLEQIRERLALLTPREHEVFRYVVSGQLNKQIAARFGVRENTIKIHRARVMQKMQTKTLADLVRAAEKAGIGGALLRKETPYPSSADDARKYALVATSDSTMP